MCEQNVLRCSGLGKDSGVQRSRLDNRRCNGPGGRYLQGLVSDVKLLCSGRCQRNSWEAKRCRHVQWACLDDVQDHLYGNTQRSTVECFVFDASILYGHELRWPDLGVQRKEMDVEPPFWAEKADLGLLHRFEILHGRDDHWRFIDVP